MTVFASHLTFAEFSGGTVPYQGKLAGEAVAAFFVLSGYVIAYVSNEKEHTLRSYAISRLARVYSVAIPAIALVIIVDLLAMHFHWPRNVPVYQYESFPKYLALAVTFTGQAGWLKESTFGGHTFWSLDYEVWYYAIFGTVFYLAGWKRLVFVISLLALAGPRILIDLPMWLLGGLVYGLHKSEGVRPRFAMTTFIGSFVLLLTFRASASDVWVDDMANSLLGGWPMAYLSNSREFGSEYIAAMLIAVNIFSAHHLCLKPLGNRTAPWITYAASFTFVLYLTQRSLLDMFTFSFGHDPHSPLSFVILVIATLFAVWLLGFVTEHRKAWWRSVFSRAIRPGTQRYPTNDGLGHAWTGNDDNPP